MKQAERLLERVQEARAFARRDKAEGLVVHPLDEIRARIAALPEDEALPDEIGTIKAGRRTSNKRT